MSSHMPTGASVNKRLHDKARMLLELTLRLQQEKERLMMEAWLRRN